MLGPRVSGSRGRLRNWRSLPIGGGRSRLLWEKHQRLSVQGGKAHRSSEKCTCREIEGDNLVLRNAIEIAVRPKAKTSWPAKFGRAVRGEDADKLSADGVVFANGRYGVGCAEGVLARHHDVAVGRNSQIERAEFRIVREPGWLAALAGGERDDGVVTHAIGADSRGEEEPPLTIEREATRKRHDSRREIGRANV